MHFDMSMPADAEVVKVARALGDPTRLRLLRVLVSRAEVSCQELTALAALAQATVSHHLKVLVDAGLASARHDGSFHRYRAHPEALRAHAAVLAALAGARTPRAARVPAQRPREKRARANGFTPNERSSTP